LTIARGQPPVRPRRKHQEEIMHPAVIRQLAADHIREMHLDAENERRARQARRARLHAPSTRPKPPACGTLSYDDPRLDAGQRPTMHEQPSAATAGDGQLAAR
jgi:hypothetical protein